MSESFFTQLATYSQRCLTGTLNVTLAEHLSWTLQLDRGGLVWAAGGIHPRRRWQRQLRQCGCPQSVLVAEERLTGNDNSYEGRLRQLAREGQISVAQARQISQGVIAEVLFDIVQAAHLAGWHWLEVAVLPRSDRAEPSAMPLESLAVDEICQHVEACWQEWRDLGLDAFSPDAMPTICDPTILQAATSSGFYAYLSALADAGQTLRDAAVGYNGSGVAELARILVPFLQRHVLALVAVPDLADTVRDTFPDLTFGSARGTMPTLMTA